MNIIEKLIKKILKKRSNGPTFGGKNIQEIIEDSLEKKQKALREFRKPEIGNNVEEIEI